MKKCQLCGQQKNLIKAHIIPEFMYKELYNEEHRFYEFAKKDILEGKKLKPFVQIGEFDKNILCSECDNERLGSLEKYAQKVLFGEKLKEAETPKCKNYKTGDYEFSECKNVDYGKIKLFLLSILWRSDITTRPTFESVNLGPHSDKIKDMIWNSNPGDENEYPITITSFIRANYHYKDLILSPRRMKSKDGINSYIFSIGSFQFHFYVNSSQHKLPEFVSEFTLKKNNTMKTVHLKDGMEKALINKLSE
ncbi:hypothetical protein [Zunongwangia sp. HGR-M22]|uniref:hypothetical protein n=1 Tax=Zunongwangia sp. HGR-M22 TaxID=3015168 RepID=UPI0022DD788C|nr:hypothetical protein [Zunongwangia sp. HGR-M22]WBL26748.1 hypothetical protein PBT91_05655 [Zunongwangia sp. HGR-M22]